jgi:hypothetical protein
MIKKLPREEMKDINLRGKNPMPMSLNNKADK